MSHDPDPLRGRQADDDAIRKAKAKSSRAVTKGRAIDVLGQEAASRPWADNSGRLLAQMHEERAEILASLSSCATPLKDRWQARLSGINLMHAGAEVELSDLCAAIDHEREQWAEPRSPAASTLQSPGDVAIQLGRIVSSLHVLISTRGLYESQTK